MDIANVGLFGQMNTFMTLFIIFFLVVLVIILYSFVVRAKRYRKDQKSPRLTVDATVVEKRTEVGHSARGDVRYGSAANAYTRYYATFEFDSGDRLEMEIDARVAGHLVEGDRGTLTFQGERFLAFEREPFGRYTRE